MLLSSSLESIMNQQRMCYLWSASIHTIACSLVLQLSRHLTYCHLEPLWISSPTPIHCQTSRIEEVQQVPQFINSEGHNRVSRNKNDLRNQKIIYKTQFQTKNYYPVWQGSDAILGPCVVSSPFQVPPRDVSSDLCHRQTSNRLRGFTQFLSRH